MERDALIVSLFGIKFITRAAIIRLAVFSVATILFCIWGYFIMIKMPGKTFAGPLPELTAEQVWLKEELSHDVQTIAGRIGERNIAHYEKLAEAADFIQKALAEADYKIRRQEFLAQGQTCCNIEAELAGAKYPDKIVIVGAHYDSVYGSAGANDNGSGVAAALAIARRFAAKTNACTIRFVFFANEEPPFYQTGEMGSLVYAKDCRKKNENIIAMLSLETIGYYTDKPNSQKYPFPFSLFYPSTGDFLGFVSNVTNRPLLKSVVGSFRRNCRFPSQGAAVPEIIEGVAWSDHWAFWQQDYPAIMITDTAPFRYPHYHLPSDTPEKLDYARLARVVAGFQAIVEELANPK